MSEIQSDAELAATEEDKEPEVKHDGFIRLDYHQKDVNNQHAKFRHEERGRVAAEEKSQKLEQELAALKSKEIDLTIPEVDRYADDHEEQVANRDAAVKRVAEHQAEETRIAESKKRNDDALAVKTAESSKAETAIFDKNMVDLGVSSEVVAVQKKIVEYGVSDDLTSLILQTPEGPLLMMYLAENPIEHGEMNNMSAYQLFEHYNSNVKAKAALLKPKTSGAPDPPIVVTGGGVSEVVEDFEKGAKYE